MGLIADSSVWIESFSKINTPPKEYLRSYIESDGTVFLCPPVYQEVLQGIREDQRFQKIKKIFQSYDMVDIDEMSAVDCAIDLFRSLRKKGITIRKPNDCLIAAYALLADLELLHHDGDFDQIAKGSTLKIVKV